VLHLDDLTMRLVRPGASFPGAPLVLSVHDPRPHNGEGNWRTTLARAVTFPRVTRFILHNATQKSDFCRRYRLNPERVDVVRLGTYDIYRELALPEVERSDRTVLFFGRLSPYKGLEVLFAAAPLVAAAVPGVRFVVAGRLVGGYRPPPPRWLPNGGTVECVYEHIPNERLGELFQTASLVVCPYVNATQSGVALTAFAFGRPVVATRVGGLPEYVHHGVNGLLVPPDDPQQLAKAMTRIMLEPDLRSSLDRGVHDLAQQELTWKRAATQTLEVYARAGQQVA
jgi:glycosyltransferase involved in cell wall biosynthesis